MNLVTVLKTKDLRKKIFFTFMMLFIYRVGVMIPVPGVDSSIIANLVEGNSLLSLYNLLVGGAFSSFTLFALGISPYITASIIIQLLTYAIPYLEDLTKSGETGRKVINKYTKLTAMILAVIQSLAITFGFVISALKDTSPLSIAVVVLTLASSSMFLVWISDKITEKGIGNGSSLVIFIGIISRLPGEVMNIYNNVISGTMEPYKVFGLEISYPIMLAIVLLISFFVIVGVIYIQEGVRKIPVQYAKKVVGRKTYGGQNSHIPMKINQSGVMPVIFASSLLALPQTLSMFMGEKAQTFVST